MNYRGRVMELDLGWSGAELRCMAAEMAAEADQEIARLRHEVAMLCGYDSADEMDAATGRRK